MASIREYFEEVETTKEYDGYYYQVGDIVSIVVLGSLYGLKNLNQLHQWTKNERTREFLRKEFKIERIPCYYWFLCLLKMVKPNSLNRCLMRWAEEMLPEDRKGVTVSVDGKIVRSTGKSEWHYYISSRKLTALELLYHSRMEWSVESMHWLLDVHFSEDFCRVEDKNVQQNLNLLRKFALSIIKSFKMRTSFKRPLSNIMFDCLLDPFSLVPLWNEN